MLSIIYYYSLHNIIQGLIYSRIKITDKAVNTPITTLNTLNAFSFFKNLPIRVPNPAQAEMEGIQIIAKISKINRTEEAYSVPGFVKVDIPVIVITKALGLSN